MDVRTPLFTEQRFVRGEFARGRPPAESCAGLETEFVGKHL